MNTKLTDIELQVKEIVSRTGKNKNQTIPILQEIQKKYKYLPAEILEEAARQTDIKLADFYGVSTFYSQFRHTPMGQHTVKVCVGTACHVKGAMQVYDAFRRELHIPENNDTDEAGKYTLEKVACLGCCTIAPVVQIDDETFAHVSTSKVNDVLLEFEQHAGNGEQKMELAPVKDESQGEIRIGLGSCCVASGSEDIRQELERELSENFVNVSVKHVGCVGVCNQVPMIEIHKNNQAPITYTKLKTEDISDILHRHFKSRQLLQRMRSEFYHLIEPLVLRSNQNELLGYTHEMPDSPISRFLDGQISIATEHRGELKPADIEEYIQKDGFIALKSCLQNKKPDEIIQNISKSGLRGRGGGGFLSGQKWQFTAQETADQKYVICNGDEGDPGAFMDRMLLESYPYRIIEGLIIAGYAVGATQGVFYIRAEYPLAVTRIREALEYCRTKGFLGQNILDSGFSFEISIFEGAGAFVCGEETALIASIEGKRGYPRLRPPYPSEKGLYQKPTLINNVETLASVAWIMRHGADEFAKIGTKNSAGTKVFALAGKTNRGGLIEVPMGTTIRHIVEKIGGGIPDGRKFKAVQIGGPSGGCIPAALADTPIDFESLEELGAMMGSGGLIVLDDTDCMVEIARYFLSFTQEQSCGRCTFCRIGTKRMLEILEKITSGRGELKDIDELERLALSTKQGSICGLGKTAPNPVLSTLRYFRHEYEAHINGKCPVGKCEPMIHYEITADCIGCTKCAQDCPVDAIAFRPHEIHEIDTEKCVKCDICRQICPVDAVIIR